MAGIEETLALDYADALAGADELERRLTEVADGAAAAIGATISAGLDDAIALDDLISEQIGSGAEAGAAEVETALAGIDAPDVAVTVDADTTDVDAAEATVEGLVDAADSVPTVVVEADASDLDAARADAQALDGEVVNVAIEVDGLDQLQEAADTLPNVGAGAADASAGLEGAGLAASAATGGIAGITSAGQKLIPTWGKAAVAAAGLTAGIEALFQAGLTAEAANRRLAQSYGDDVEALQDLSSVISDLPASVDTLKELTLATGSSGAGVKTAIANFADLGAQSGATREQLVQTGKEFGVLANYVAATRPELGTADQIADRLGLTLARGGRFAARFGLDVGTSAEIADRASAMYGKPVDALTLWEKATAGMQMALERLGPAITQNLEAGLDNPVVKLRVLERELKGVLAAAGQPLVAPIIDTLERLQPLALGTAEAFGKLAGGVLPGLAAAIEPFLAVLDGVASLFAAIPTKVLAAGAAFLAAQKFAGPLIGLVSKLSGSLSTLATRLGGIGQGVKFSNIAAQFRGLEAQTVRYTEAAGAAAQANNAFGSELAKQGATNATAAAALTAHTRAVAADTAVMEANLAVGNAQAEVRAAEAAVAEGQAGSEARLAAAREGAKTAATNLATAEAAAATARAESVVATDAAIASAGAGGGKLAGLADNATRAGAGALKASEGVAAAGASAGGAASLIGPLGLVLGIAAGAWAIFGNNAEKAKAKVDEGKKSVEAYKDSLELSNAELAKLDPRQAATAYQRSGEGAQKFWDSLSTDLQEAFGKIDGLSLDKAGRALNGNQKAAEDFRRSLIRAGEVTFLKQETLKQSEAGRAELRRLQEEYIRTGESASVLDRGRVAEVFEEQVSASAAVQKSLREEAKAEIEAGNAKDTNAIAALAATGAISELGSKSEAAGRALLAQADAVDQAAERTTAFEVAAVNASGAQATLLDTVNRASEAMAGGIDPGFADVAAARALAASDSFGSLPKSVQDATTAIIDYADETNRAAAESGALVSSTGEVVGSFQTLTDSIDKAIQKYDELSGVEQRRNAAQRDLDATLRDVDNQVNDLGTSLDATNAQFSANAVTADNYRRYLELLPAEVQRFIESAKGAEDTPLTDEQKAAAVGKAIMGNAEALSEATDLARDNADSLTDYFDSAVDAIRKQGEELTKTDGLDAANRFVGERIGLLRQAATEAGISQEAFDAYLATTGVGVTGFSEEAVNTSGLDAATRKLDLLRTTIGLLPPEAQVRINAIDDATEQAAAIEQELGKLPPEKQIAIRTAQTAEAQNDITNLQFALLSLTNRPWAIAIGAKATGLSEQVVSQALAAIDAWNSNPVYQAKGLELPVTVQSANFLAEVDRETQAKIAKIKVEPGTEEYAVAMEDILAEKEKKIRVYAETGEAQGQIDPLTADDEKNIKVKFNVPEWAKKAFGIGTKKEPLTGEAEVDVSTTESGGGATPAGQRGPDRTDRNERRGRRAAGGRVLAGRTYSVNEKRRLIPPGTEAFVPDLPATTFTPSVNGTVVPDVAASSALSGSALPVLLPPPATEAVAAPSVAPAATTAAKADPALLAALGRLSETVAAPAPAAAAPGMVIEAGAITVGADAGPSSYQTARQIVDQLVALNFRQTGVPL